MGQRDGNAHPVPGVFLVIRRLIPVRHEKQRLDEDEPIGIVVKVIE